MVSRLSLAGLTATRISWRAARYDLCGRHSRLTFPDCSGSTVEEGATAEAIRCHALLRGRRGAQTCVGGTTTMIGIGIFFSVVGLGYLCWALFEH
jgi:hypothetical protein